MKKRKVSEDDDDDFGGEDSQQRSCTTLDHVYPPNPQPDTRCYCGKRSFKPFIKLDDYLTEGMIIRMLPGGPLFEIVSVNQSRAYCWPISATEALGGRSEEPTFLPMPGMPEFPLPGDERRVDDRRSPEDRRSVTDGGINISPRSAVIRVSTAELEQEAYNRNRSQTMGAVANMPVGKSAGKSVKDANKERLARLANKPAGAARPLTGAAAKAKASARPKAEKTVKPCGCGCGEETTAYFAPGHDARFKGWIKKAGDGRLSLDELKKLMGAKTFSKYTFKKSGAGFVTKTTYQEAAGA